MQLELQREAVPALLLGVFVALVGVATVVGMPWQHTGGGIAMILLRGGGSLLVAALGVALVVVALQSRGE